MVFCFVEQSNALKARQMSTSCSRVPDGFEFRVPWHCAEHALREELLCELPTQHRLYGVEARAVARRQDNDDVLFELFGSEAPAEFAVVHLTWSGKPEPGPKYPWTELYGTFSEWVTHRMTPDADEWS